ncbi:hypothetical protein [Paenibacillus durus]|uniref:Uncharacterized protein n=1 Tax=Paenibacillus durus TaxID=44251 RepID=A0A089J259_PAEDU|nr:hypothetical protein [Paenibacillus durus]AIQ15269.1 hypothetical protein PDUR_27980 [Paenibacillus durus]
MRDIEVSRLLSVSHGEGFCDCCEDWKPLVLLDGSAELIGLCLNCLPSVIKGLEAKALELADK